MKGTITEKLWLPFGVLTCLVSFYFCSGINPDYFNSDQAIQVLMLKYFSWPRDAYYWGQNRLGSLLPLLTYPFYKLLRMHPVVLISVIDYLMLFTGWLLLCRFIKWPPAKMLFALALFFPHFTFLASLLIGHPYQAQFFAIAVSAAFLPRMYQTLIQGNTWRFADYMALFFALCFAWVAIWVSELSACYLVFIVLVFVIDKGLRKQFFDPPFFKQKLLAPFATGIALMLAGFFIFADLKKNFPADDVYDAMFINSAQQVHNQWHYFYMQLRDVFLLQNHYSLFECIFYYGLLVVGVLLFFSYHKMTLKYRSLLSAWLLTLLIAFVLLFFSSWNYRSRFDPKYFSVVYMFIWIPVGMVLHCLRAGLRYFALLLLVVPIVFTAVAHLPNHYTRENIFDEYAGYERLRPATVIGDYWKVFRLAAVVQNRFEPVSVTWWDRRNSRFKAAWLANQNVYIYPAAQQLLDIKNDTLRFEGMVCRRTHDTIVIKADTFILFTKLP